MAYTVFIIYLYFLKLPHQRPLLIVSDAFHIIGTPSAGYEFVAIEAGVLASFSFDLFYLLINLQIRRLFHSQINFKHQFDIVVFYYQRYKCELYNVTRAAALTRVGHTAHHLQVNGNPDWILLVGGANLSRCCKNALLVNIRKGQFHSTDQPDTLPDPGLARYEQSSCIYDDEVCNQLLFQLFETC